MITAEKAYELAKSYVRPTDVWKIIEESAKIGLVSCYCRFKNSTDALKIAKELQAAGFEVKYFYDELFVSWS